MLTTSLNNVCLNVRLYLIIHLLRILRTFVCNSALLELLAAHKTCIVFLIAGGLIFRIKQRDYACRFVQIPTLLKIKRQYAQKTVKLTLTQIQPQKDV